MPLDLLAVENLIQKENDFKFLNPKLQLEFKSTINSKKVNYQKLKENYLLKRHESEYLKNLCEFNFKPPSKKDLTEQVKITALAKNENQGKKEMIQEFKGNLELACDLMTEDYEKMIRERDDMIECLAKCREMDEEYEQIFIASQQLDQNAVLLELEKEKVSEEQEMEKLMAELKEAQDALDVAQNRLYTVSDKLPALEAKTMEAEEREKEAIRIANEKDPQVEELGKWYKESISLLSTMHNISAFTLCSDTKFQVEYFGGEFIINYILNPEGTNGRLVEIEMLKGVLVIYDIIDASAQFATMNQALTFIVTQIYLRLQAKKDRNLELEPLIQRGIASFEEGSNELLIQSESTARCFLIRLGPMYPFGGLKGAKMALIEVLEENESLEEWTEKIQSFSTVTELIPTLV